MSQDHLIGLDVVASTEVSKPTLWKFANFSESWYQDAVREAAGTDEHATRLEIVFSACFLESYIFEWVRGFGIEYVNNYFPPGNYRSLKVKWKEVPTELFNDGLISTKPDLVSSPWWYQFCELVEYRNGLVHARASRPSTGNLPENARPVPDTSILRDSNKHGWAISVAAWFVKKLHQDIGTPCPIYIRK